MPSRLETREELNSDLIPIEFDFQSYFGKGYAVGRNKQILFGESEDEFVWEYSNYTKINLKLMLPLKLILKSRGIIPVYPIFSNTQI